MMFAKLVATIYIDDSERHVRVTFHDTMAHVIYAQLDTVLGKAVKELQANGWKDTLAGTAFHGKI